ncbi:SHOCT domain-containing protein [Agromyces sp. NPDC056379]|uniref:SHOCT domain-containing protein n=1 Tax=unclassified Agromyces TaxID=2639701 RepID=UPI0035D5DBF0
MFTGFTGWHALIILGVFVFFAAIAVGVLLLIRYAAKSGTTAALESAGPPPGAGERLDQLERLRSEARITEAEYTAKRAEILGGL